MSCQDYAFGFTSLTRARQFTDTLDRAFERPMLEIPHPSAHKRFENRTLKDYLDWGYANSKKGGRANPWNHRLAILNTVITKTVRLLSEHGCVVPEPNPVCGDNFSKSVAEELKTKEDNMSLAVLAILARPQKTYEGLNDAASNALELAMAKRRAAQEEELGECLEGMLSRQDAKVANAELNIRKMKEEIAEREDHLARIKRAFDYARETNNYIPWACALGYSYGELSLTRKEFNELSAVPEDWESTPELESAEESEE